MVVTIGLISMKRILIRWEMLICGRVHPALSNQTRYFTEIGAVNQPATQAMSRFGTTKPSPPRLALSVLRGSSGQRINQTAHESNRFDVVDQQLQTGSTPKRIGIGLVNHSGTTVGEVRHRGAGIEGNTIDQLTLAGHP